VERRDQDAPTSGAVVVVNYASSALLRTNLVPLGGPGRPFRVVVVDNLSTPDERATVTRLAREHDWDLVARENRGFGAGINAGVTRATALGCTSVLALNPDVQVEPSVVVALLSHVDDERDALVTPALRHADGSATFAEGTLDLVRGTTRTRPPLDPAHERWLSGACLAMSADLWRRVGGLAEDYFMYWEDLELSHRCQAAGGRLVVRGDLHAVHAVGGTQGEGKSPLYRYYNCRNRLLFARRNLPRRLALRWLATAPAYARRIALRDGRRAVVRHPWATVLPVVRGSLAGVRIVLVGR
jgi:N-acetylglucosaminyl-diphospho-decaprenol L-rhamnosyltransferase